MCDIEVNGLAMLIWSVATVGIGLTCYVWGRSDGRDAERIRQNNIRNMMENGAIRSPRKATR